MKPVILAFDQSTQGTKVMLFDENGVPFYRADKPHRQIINERGWVEHDPEEIWQNVLTLTRQAIEQTGIDPAAIAAIGISNQRETAMAWQRSTGKPIYNAIVWQCARGTAICERIAKEHPDAPAMVQERTGIRFSPYFSAAKLAWVLENVLVDKNDLCCGTMDSFLVWRMTEGRDFRTDYSNASRTQLFNIRTLTWDADICGLFGIPLSALPEVTDSDGCFGATDMAGILPHRVPIHGVLGDSHAALFGQGCVRKGMMKATYGTGSSMMMNVGETPVFSESGLVTSLAWKMGGQVNYVLEGNINYTGAVITWMKDDLGLIASPSETETLALAANPADATYLVPAFSGLGAPYWCSDVSAAFVGMSRTTGRKELVKAGLESIAYQISDIVALMRSEIADEQIELRTDGGPTRNKYLMQFQSDLLSAPVMVSQAEELSCIGAAWAAGIGAGLLDQGIFACNGYTAYKPVMQAEERTKKLNGWQDAISRVLLDKPGSGMI